MELSLSENLVDRGPRAWFFECFESLGGGGKEAYKMGALPGCQGTEEVSAVQARSRGKFGFCVYFSLCLCGIYAFCLLVVEVVVSDR